MAREIPPWVSSRRDGKDVVQLGEREYPVDISKPPVFFYWVYLQARLPRPWMTNQAELPVSEQHPLMRWLRGFEAFLTEFERRGRPRESKEFFASDAMAAALLAHDLYFLDGNKILQDALVQRLTDRVAFQGARHEVAVAATMVRAGFEVEFEDETDSSRKHPEFVATHHHTRTRIAVEAKSIHRTGVLGYRNGNPPPALDHASFHKIAAQVCGQVQRALPKAHNLPLYVFVDLNLTTAVANALGAPVLNEIARILPHVDTGWNRLGVFEGKRMNLLTVTNWPMHLGETGETLNLFLDPAESDCQFPEGSRHTPGVKAAVKQYGTVEIRDRG
jgi:hypothetical protein